MKGLYYKNSDPVLLEISDVLGKKKKKIKRKVEKDRKSYTCSLFWIDRQSQL